MAIEAQYDAVMWVRDGMRTLPRCALGIGIALEGRIGRKIAIDDGSRDGSAEFLKGQGWHVFHNTKGGIGNAANQALALVQTPWFASVEQDVVLPAGFLAQLEPWKAQGVAVVSGRRYASVRAVASVERYLHRFPPGEKDFPSIDCAIWNTGVMRKVGFATANHTCDTMTWRRILAAGCRSVAVPECAATHLKRGVRHDWQDWRKYGRVNRGIEEPWLWKVLWTAVKSPVAGLRVAAWSGDPLAWPVYVGEKLSALAGAVEGEIGALRGGNA